MDLWPDVVQDSSELDAAVLAMPKIDSGATSIPEVPVLGKVAMAPIEWAAVAQQCLTEVRDLVIAEGVTSWFRTAVLQVSIDNAKSRSRVSLPVRVRCATAIVTKGGSSKVTLDLKDEVY